MHAAVAAHDVQLVFAVLTDDAERERFARFARGGHVDGVAFVSLHGADPLPRGLQDAGVPVMLQGRPWGTARDEPAPVGYVDADNHGGARAATRLLAEAGRTRIGTVTGPLDMAAAVDRFDGYRCELAALGLAPAGVAHADFSVVGGRRRCRTLLDADAGPRRRRRRQRPDGAGCAAGAQRAGPAGARRRRAGRVRRHPAGRRGRSPADDRAPAHGRDGPGIATALLEMVDARSPRPPLVLPTEIVRRARA